MRLDVIVATLNRRELLARALDSLFAAPVPDGMDVRVTVADNGSHDGTVAYLRERARHADGRLHLVVEPRRGKSRALNAALAATDGDLTGFVDDDEEIGDGWYHTVHRAFQDESVDFVGGPYLPRWGAPPPPWLPRGYAGVIGWVEGEARVQEYGGDYPGMLMGGNAVIRRRVLDRVGPYSTALGPGPGGRLLSCEDDDMYRRLLDHGARGLYLPDLVIHHWVPPERLTRRYYRRWCFWHGVSQGVLDRERPAPVAYLAGIPRHLFGTAARGMARWAVSLAGLRRAPEAFSGELAVWDLAGFLYGKHVHAHRRTTG
jgi:glycosyltransferase involved in cell wall biosynthesis